MKIKQQSKKKQIIIGLVLAITLIGAGTGAYWVLNRDQKDNQAGINLEPATKSEEDAGKQSKDQTVDSDTSSNSSKENSSETPSPVTPAQPVVIPMRITASAQNGNVYQIRTLIERVVNGGTCTITLTKGNQKVTKSATTQALAQSSTCQGFDIPVSELELGTWQVSIALTGSEYSGNTSGTIEIK